MNQIHKYSLDEYSPRVDQTPLVGHLLPHQLQCLQKMKTIEESRNKGIWLDDEHLVSSYGILGDVSGSGKTFTMLGHIGQMTEHPFGIHTYTSLSHDSLPSLYSVTQTMYDDAMNTLIVVPPPLIHHWQTCIQTTKLTSHVIKSQRDIDEQCIRKMRQSHITLISSTLLKPLTALLSQKLPLYFWERVVYDEADMIRIPASCPFIHSKMTWLISARYKNITHANQQIHSHILQQLSPDFVQGLELPLQKLLTVYTQEHPVLVLYKTVSHSYFNSILRTTHPSRGYFVITSEESFLQGSMQLPDIVCTTRICKPMFPLHHIQEQTRALMSIGSIEEAVLSIQPRIVERKEFIDSIVCPFKKERLESTTCTICFEPADSVKSVPCISPCCTNLFCGSCILRWLDANAVCPLCRTELVPSTLVKIQYGPVKKDKDAIETLIDALRERGDGQYLVVSAKPQEIYNHIRKHLPTLEKHIDILHGHPTTIVHRKASFDSKHLRVLVLPIDTLGLTFPNATHMILMNSTEDVLGRAQCVGREQPLQVLRILGWY